jgi:hypothetical protein
MPIIYYYKISIFWGPEHHLRCFEKQLRVFKCLNLSLSLLTIELLVCFYTLDAYARWNRSCTSWLGRTFLHAQLGFSGDQSCHLCWQESTFGHWQANVELNNHVEFIMWKWNLTSLSHLSVYINCFPDLMSLKIFIFDITKQLLGRKPYRFLYLTHDFRLQSCYQG